MFEELTRKNIETLRRMDVRKIITMRPTAITHSRMITQGLTRGIGILRFATT